MILIIIIVVILCSEIFFYSIQNIFHFKNFDLDYFKPYYLLKIKYRFFKKISLYLEQTIFILLFISQSILH